MDTWQSYIASDLKARIDGGTDLPCRWTLQVLADEYQVSLMPIRSAVDDLLLSGYLQKQPNGRLAVVEHKLGVVGPKAIRPAPPEDPYDTIVGDVVLVCLKEDSQFLREEEMARQYGISPSAARQVLARLAGKGILEHVPRRGWRTKPFCQKQLEDYTRVRKLLEVESLRLAWPRLDDTRLRKIRDGNRPPRRSNEEPLVDDSFHAYLIELSGNEFIADFFARHKPRINVFFAWEGLDRKAAIETAHQHRAVLDALLDRDQATAQKALLDHLNYSHERLIDEMKNRFFENE